MLFVQIYGKREEINMDLSQMSPTVRNSYKHPDTMLYQVASMVHGEMAGKDKKFKRMAISSFINRINTREWEGKTTKQILEGGYDAVQNRNEPFTQATTKNFPDEKSENEFKKDLALVSSMFRGKGEKYNNQFFLTDDEVKDQKRLYRETDGERGMNFDLLEKTERGKLGKYNLFKYK